MAGVNTGVVRQGEDLAANGFDDLSEICWRVGPAGATRENGVAGEQELSGQKANTAGGVSRRVKDV